MNESIKNLLSLNNKALQFAHDVDGFDFEKPYFITESADRFTVNTVKKAVAEAMNPAKCKIVLLSFLVCIVINPVYIMQY